MKNNKCNLNKKSENTGEPKTLKQPWREYCRSNTLNMKNKRFSNYSVTKPKKIKNAKSPNGFIYNSSDLPKNLMMHRSNYSESLNKKKSLVANLGKSKFGEHKDSN